MSQQQGEPFGPVEPQAPDLSTVTKAQLVTELKSRHDALVVLGEIDRTDEDTAWCTYTKGPLSRVIGILSRAISRYKRHARRCDDESSEAD